ncbi:rust resistance kinase Lr10-like [Henckelia pumila]|uniref:rust resistance kinase Lr10-like n=1 Tax=Henckelia pumila TaxID=405737 RepID=UPI003C6E1171
MWLTKVPHKSFLIFLTISLHFSQPRFAAAQDECQPMSCGVSGPVIRFPFRLKGRQPERCSYPGFDLSCTSHNITEFIFQFPLYASTRNIILPVSAKAAVKSIDYKTQFIWVSVLSGSCLPNRVPAANSSATVSPFQLYYPFTDPNGYTLFNCSAKPRKTGSLSPVTCLSNGTFQVYAVPSSYSVTAVYMPSCVKMYNVSAVSKVIFEGLSRYGNDDDTQLHWHAPFCGVCEEKGMYCRLKSNSTDNNETECFQITKPHGKDGNSKKVVTAIVTVGVSILTLAVAALYRVYIVKKRKRDNQRRIEQFLVDYNALRPTRYKYSDVKRMTDGFRYRLGQGGYGTVYKGKLSNDILVAVKVLNSMEGNSEEFLNEVGTIGQIHHVNIVRLVGYCADGYRNALVYEFLQNGSLEKYICSGNHRRKIGWEKMHQIASGLAKGIDYLHHGCNQRILHFDIKPQNILLDQNLNPKVADFGLAKLCSKEQSMVKMTAARGTVGYIAPEVFSRNFGKVSYRSDIYSFGMLLLDMVGGRKNFQARSEGSSEVYFPEWMYNQLDKGEDIGIQMDNEGENNIVKRLIIVGLWCIQWYPADRPSMKMVIKMLEGEDMPIMPPNPFATCVDMSACDSSPSGSSS